MLKFCFQFPHLSSLTFSLQPSAEKSHFTCPTRSRPAVQPGVAGCSRSTQPCRFAPFLPRGRSTRTTKGLIRESCSSPFKRCTMHMYWHRLVAVCVFFFFLQPHRRPKQYRKTMMKQRCWMQPLLDKSRPPLQSPTHVDLGCQPYTYFTCGVSFLRNSRCQKKPLVFACLSTFAQKINSAAWWSSPRACPSKLRTKSTMVWKENIDLSRSGGETHPFGRRTHPMESSILRLTRAVRTTSVASTPQNVSGLAVGQGSHAWIFVDLRLCGDRSACRVWTPPSAPDTTVLTSSKLRFWHALECKIKEEKTCRQGSWTINCKLTTEKVCFFPPKDEVVRLRGTQQPIVVTAKRLIECNQPCTDRKCHVALKQRKALNFAFTPSRI